MVPTSQQAPVILPTSRGCVKFDSPVGERKKGGGQGAEGALYPVTGRA